MKIRRITKAVLTILFTACLGGCQHSGEIRYEAVTQEEQTETVITDGLTEAREKETQETIQQEAQAEICYVHICGAVLHPGVYQVAKGSRLYEVILLAGGMTAEASDREVNQAAPVEDGMQIYIPTLGENSSDAPQAGTDAEDGMININTADTDALCTLPGIGESRARAIITYREEHGDFNNIEELMNVTGIKQGIYDQLKDYIKV